MLSQALEKDTIFKVTMQIPPSLLSPMVCVCVCKCIYMCVYVCIFGCVLYLCV